MGVKLNGAQQELRPTIKFEHEATQSWMGLSRSFALPLETNEGSNAETR
jgi:hypothetical protein